MLQVVLAAAEMLGALSPLRLAALGQRWEAELGKLIRADANSPARQQLYDLCHGMRFVRISGASNVQVGNAGWVWQPLYTCCEAQGASAVLSLSWEHSVSVHAWDSAPPSACQMALVTPRSCVCMWLLLLQTVQTLLPVCVLDDAPALCSWRQAWSSCGVHTLSLTLRQTRSRECSRPFVTCWLASCSHWRIMESLGERLLEPAC